MNLINRHISPLGPKAIDRLSFWHQKNPVLSASLAVFFGTFIYSTAYCQGYMTYVLGIGSSLTESLIWTVKKFALWWLLSPFIFSALMNHAAPKWGFITRLFLASICINTAYSIAVDMWHIHQNQHIFARIISFAPLHLAFASILFLSYAALILRPAKKKVPSKKGPKQHHTTLAVQSGTQTVLLSTHKIESISACGNYMEVSDGLQHYILRKPMKELVILLEGAGFIRVHRSHLINTHLVRKISSKHTVTLASGVQFPVSQKFKHQLKEIKIP